MKSSIINLVKTAQGYSIIEGDVEINKVAQVKPTKQKLYSAPKKFTQQTFTIYPYIYTKQKEKQNHKYLLFPARAQWFNPSIVHEIQKKALPEWFKIRKGMLATMNQTKFEKNQDLYKKYRNYIIQLGKDSYVSALRARKGLAGDVCSIIRIHSFLQKWGLINFVHQKPRQLVHKQTGQIHNNCYGQSQNKQGQKRKDCFDKDKNTLSRNYNKDDLQLIKKVTKKYRPLCHYCEGICGISWYEYKQKMFVKELKEDIQTHVNTVCSNLTFDYTIIMCFHCFIQGNIPVILQQKDFLKVSVLNKIDEKIRQDSNSKKKINEFNKIADIIQKNRFNLKKSAQNLKITEQSLFNSLMVMPLQKIQKMSRIQPQTDQEDNNYNQKQLQMTNHAKCMNGHQKQNNLQGQEGNMKQNQKEMKLQNQADQKLEDIFHKNISTLQLEEKECYEKFLQAWLLKMYTKLQKLQTWDKVVNWNANRLQSIYKQNIVKKVKNSIKYERQQKKPFIFTQIQQVKMKSNNDEDDEQKEKQSEKEQCQRSQLIVQGSQLNGVCINQQEQ